MQLAHIINIGKGEFEAAHSRPHYINYCFVYSRPFANLNNAPTFKKVGIVSGDPPLSASSTSYASTCRFR